MIVHREIHWHSSCDWCKVYTAYLLSSLPEQHLSLHYMYTVKHPSLWSLCSTTYLDTGTALGWGWAWGWTDQLAVKTTDALPSGSCPHLIGSQNVRAERLHGIQPLDLYQAGQEVGDAVACCAHSLKELQAITHAANLIPLQPKALSKVSPRLHHGRLAAVGGAQHAARLLQAVKGKLRGTQAWGGTGAWELNTLQWCK